MMLRRLETGLCWCGDGPLSWKAPLAGPFETRDGAYWWMVSHLETTLSAPKKLLWGIACDQMGSAPDVAHLMGLIMAIDAGRTATGTVTEAWVRKAAVPMSKTRYDRRLVSTGERDA